MDKAIEYLIAIDPVIDQLYNKYKKPYISTRPEGFETLCKLILEQQVSLASAKACYLRLKLFLGEITPTTISKASSEDLNANSVSRQKVIYLKALSNAILEKEIDLQTLSLKSSDEVRKELIKIKGIGNWTIDVYLMFSLHKENVIPLGDIAIKNTIKELYSCSSDEQILEVSNKWKPYRTMASFFLWHYYLEKRNRKPLVY
ncbi:MULTISPECIES: DNA-3-methyladenine glycosylase family protein [Flavobacterium]|uniref:DNA-3-methyladenine glycosylase II n=1 Tax=Flavobacterium jumunjinense TaxID=998845 RepID=A0ABV5GIV0_9FLAO|nr:MULTISPECIES: DNA-3-methyladenine glycosylase 2 family protein [Flavobacterium]